MTSVERLTLPLENLFVQFAATRVLMSIKNTV